MAWEKSQAISHPKRQWGQFMETFTFNSLTEIVDHLDRLAEQGLEPPLGPQTIGDKRFNEGYATGLRVAADILARSTIAPKN